jgi:hypothetical protein
MKRSLATTLALAVSGSLVILSPAAARSAPTGETDGDPGPSAGPEADGLRSGDAALPERRHGRQARGYQWPVALQVADLYFYEDPPTGVAAQQFASARVRQDRRDGTVNAWITLRAAPSQPSNSWVVVSFGTSNPATGTCEAEADHGVAWHTWGVDEQHLDRNGAQMRLYDYPLPGARTLQWDCAFAQTWTLDWATQYDGRSNYLRRVLARPGLVVKAANKRVTPKRFVRLPVRVKNKASALGKAPGVRLTWRGKGLTVRGSHRLGAIKPGRTQRKTLRVRLDRRRKAVLKLVVKTGDIRKVKKVVIRPR